MCNFTFMPGLNQLAMVNWFKLVFQHDRPSCAQTLRNPPQAAAQQHTHTSSGCSVGLQEEHVCVCVCLILYQYRFKVLFKINIF